ncbi:MAG: hypothetical protein ACRDEB_07600, partial [Chitinophagaceae bacterium]
MKVRILFGIIAGLIMTCAACHDQKKENKTNTAGDEKYSPRKYVELKHPEWSKNATIYEVNLRQY